MDGVKDHQRMCWDVVDEFVEQGDEKGLALGVRRAHMSRPYEYSQALRLKLTNRLCMTLAPRKTGSF